MKQALVILAVLAGVAHADKDKDKEKADALFKQGKRLMGEKRYADACKAFEESFTLDPGIGAQLNVAKCYEEWNKLAAAYRAYQKAEDLAKEQHDSRVGKIHEIMDSLDASVPKLTIKLSKDGDTDGLKVTIDGAAVEIASLSEPQMVDPGPHLIEWQSPGHKKKSKVIPFDRGASSEVTLDLPAKKVVKPDKVKPDKVKPVEEKPVVVDPGRNRKLLAYGLGGGGVLAIGISSIMTLTAKSKYNDALAAHCMNSPHGCDPTGLEQTHSARTTANIATVIFVVGLGAAGAGAYLYFTAPKPTQEKADEGTAIYVAPEVYGDGGGLVLGGSF